MELFKDRDQAANLLAERLRLLKGRKPLVLGVPRGAVPMAKIIADSLDGDLDVILVHKFALRQNPELAIGSVTEDGDVFLGVGARLPRLNEAEVAEAARVAIAKLQAQRRLLTPHRRPMDLKGRLVILVDDGIATGATMLAAVRHVRDGGANHIVIATPVASGDSVRSLENEGAEVVTLHVPEIFYAVSQFYEDFIEIEDGDVIRALSGEPPELKVSSRGVTLLGRLTVPSGARGIILFAHGSGSGRRSPRNQFVAGELQAAGFATLLADLLQEKESESRSMVFDINLLAERLALLEDWIEGNMDLRSLPLGLFGASTGAAAAVRASARDGSRVRAIVSRGGRPDLAMEDLGRVRAATLLIVGGEDEPVLSWNRAALARLTCEKELSVISGATHLFEEPGALEAVANLARAWFTRHLVERVGSERRSGANVSRELK